MAVGAINQNDIIDIIKSQVDTTNTIIGIVIDNTSKYVKDISESKINNMLAYIDAVDFIYSDFIVKIHKILYDIENMKFNPDFNIDSYINSINKIFDSIETIEINDNIELKVNLIRTVINSISEATSIQSIEIPDFNIDSYINGIDKVFNSIEAIEINDNVELKVKLIRTVINSISEATSIQSIEIPDFNIDSYISNLNNIISEIREININPVIIVKISGVIYIIGRLSKIYDNIEGFDKKLENLDDKVKKLDSLKIYIGNILNILQLVNDIKFNQNLPNKLNIIAESYQKLLECILNIEKYSEIDINKLNKVENVIERVSKVISYLVTLAKKMAVLSILAAVIIIASPVILLGLSVIFLFIKTINLISGLVLSDDAKSNMGSILVIVIALIGVALSMIALGLLAEIIVKYYISIMVTLILIATILYSVSLISRIAASPRNILNMIILSVIISSIIIIAGEIVMLGVMSTIALSLSGNIFLFMLLLVGIVASIILLGIGLTLASPFILSTALILIPLAVAIASIVAIAIMLTVLKYLVFTETDRDIISNNISNIISTALVVISSIFYSDGGIITNPDATRKKMTNDPWVVKILRGIFNGSGLAAQAILSSAILAPLIISTLAILLISGILWLLGKINFTDEDKNNIKENVKIVIFTAFNVINSIFEPNSSDTENKPDSRNWFTDIIKYTMGGLSNLIASVMSVGFLALTIVSVGLILILAGALKLLQSESITSLDTNAIKTNIQNIIGCALSIIDSIFNRTADTKEDNKNKSIFGKALSWVSDKIGGFFSGIENIIGMVASMGFLAMSLISIGMVYILAKQLTYISEINFTPSAIINKLKVITDTSNILIDTLSGVNMTDNFASKVEKIQKNTGKLNSVVDLIKKLTESMDGLTSVSDKDVQNNAKVVNNYIKFVDKINSVRVENVKTMTNMFKQMAEFSKSINGNFDSLADALVEKIAPLLEELKELMEKMPTDFNASIQSSSETISKTIVNTSGSPSMWSRDNINTVAQITQNKDEQERIKSSQENKMQNAKEDERKVMDILRDILDTMNGQGMYSRGVKTY